VRRPFKRRHGGVRDPSRPAPDERIWGRHYTGPAPWIFGAFIVLLLAIGTYLAFAKKLPWSSPGYELEATFQNAATLRETAPVRIAGVNVGQVTNVEGDGGLVRVTFTVDEDGRPIHEDAEVEIRPRLFLEGNFFIDLDPGSPSAEELPDGGDIPMTQTATAVQLDEVLTALQAPTRRGLQRTLQGFGTALNYEPTPADDLTQDPDVAGESAGESLNDAFRYGGRAGRTTAIVSRALRGERQGDLAGLIRSGGQVFAKLASREDDLAELITNFNVTTQALATEAANVEVSLNELGPTLEETEVSLRHLSTALPPLRTLAIVSRPGIQELPATIDAFGPWLDQVGPLTREQELGGLARLLKNTAPGLAQTADASARLFPEIDRISRCSSENLIPTADVPITADSSWGVGQPNFNEFFYGATQLVGAAQSFDGNGPIIRIQAGGGPVLVHNPNPTGLPEDQVNFAQTIEAPGGIQPVLPSSAPPFRPDVNCSTNALPDLNGPAAATGPPDLTP
jgi:phospholipid/cholesterol/gamma-HCH transport system substrate-binding protein